MRIGYASIDLIIILIKRAWFNTFYSDLKYYDQNIIDLRYRIGLATKFDSVFKIHSHLT
jgi:hypothetical protein